MLGLARCKSPTANGGNLTKSFLLKKPRLLPVTMSLCCGLFAFQLCGPQTAFARPTQSAVKVVDVSLRKLGDKVEITVEGTSALNDPTWVWTGNPKRLRLSLKGTKLSYKAARMPLDVGVLQWVETSEDAGTLRIDLAASSAPKNSADINAAKTVLHWTISCNEMSNSEALPKLSQSSGSVADSTPKSTPSIKPVVPKKTAVPKPVVEKKPATSNVPPVVAQTPAKPPAASPVTPTKPVAVKPPDVVPVSANTPPQKPDPRPADKVMTFKANGSLKEVLESLAREAGLKAEIGPGVEGTVSQGYKDMPLNRIVSSILGQQPVLFDYKLTGTTLTVTAPTGSGGVSMQKVENSNRILKSEYFPIHDKRAVDLMEVVRKAVPGPSYTLEERLNQILVEGEPAEIERVRKLLQAVGSK